MLSSRAVGRAFEPLVVYIKDYEKGMCGFFAQHVTLRRQSKDWLARNQDNVFEY